MDRKDFVERGEVKVDFLKYYRLVSRWAVNDKNLSVADLELLFYLHPIKWFTIIDFQDGTLYYSWDPRRFYRLQKDGWIKKIHEGRGRGGGGHNKYTLTKESNLLINRIYRMLIGQEDIPESAKRNRIMKGERYIDKVYSKAIKKFNKDKNK